jgi:hypothetical protein
VNAERLAGSTIAAALDPDLATERRARLALDIIEAVDPKQTSVVTVSGEIDPANASLGELLRFAEAHQIDLS